MFQLREAHTAAFESIGEMAFVQRLMAHVCEHHDEVVSDFSREELSRRIGLGIRRARSVGFSDERSITAFVAIMLEVSPRFDAHPAIREILTNSDYAPEARLECLERGTSLSDWEEAAALPTEWTEEVATP